MSIFRKKWLGRAVISVLACIVFLGLKDHVTASADEPEPAEATARIIYANNLDSDENGSLFATSQTQYSFAAQDENYRPYAIYVNPVNEAATNAAITLDTSLVEADVYHTIKIWDNDCGILVDEAAGWIDNYALVLTGDNSYLDIGWSHYNRGGCTADKYTGDDTAADIANYFNGFIFIDDDNPENVNYWNDISITICFDPGNKEENPEDPHYGKTVVTVDWDFSVTHLTLEDNVILFLQDRGNDPSEGFLRISGSLNLGSGSLIEAVDDRPRLEINGDISVSGMSFYDYFGDSGETPLSHDLNGLYCFTDLPDIGLAWTMEHSVDDSGNPDVIYAAKKYIYAYANLDYDGDGYADEEDLKLGLAAELLVKFRNTYGRFGCFDDYDGPSENAWDNVLNDAKGFRNRISLDNTGSITATDSGGNSVPLTQYTATVSWGHEWDSENEIIGEIYVYQLNSPEDVLVCTDFNEETGTGTTWYVRDRFADKKVLVGDVDSDWSQVDEDYFTSVIVTDSIVNVAAGGHGVSLYAKNIDNNLFTFQTLSYFNMKFYENSEWHELDVDTFIKIFTNSGKYFATASEGEEKRYDFVSNDATGNAADKIWEAGGQNPVKLFIHDNILHVMPLNANSIIGKELKAVRLTGNTPQRAVAINNSNPGDIVITFNSNFYDTVSFELVFADDTTGTFTVEREGIIIQYTGLGDNNEIDGTKDRGRYWLDIYGEGEGNEFNYTYDYDSESFVVMASYYHSSAETGKNDLSLIITYDDDGSTEVISSVDEAHNFSGYKSGESYTDGGNCPAAVDTTTFIIGFMKHDGENSLGTNFTFSANGHTGGFSVQVVNSGFDAEDSFGGALAGSGKGKHWDGNANVSY